MRTDVLVAGGGLAGLACAMGLRGSGLHVTLVEAASQLGGRARSWRDELTGDPVDVGPHVVTTHHLNFLDVLRSCGTLDRVVWQRSPLLTLFDGSRHDVRLASLPAPFAMMPALFANPVSLRARFSNLAPSREALRLIEADVHALDAHLAIDYLRSRHVKPEFIDWFWRSMAMVLLNVPLEHCSAGALMRCYAQLLGHSRYCFGFPDGALDALFLPGMREAIEVVGGRVLTEAAMSSLRFEGTRCIGGKLADGSSIEARHVVCALPPAETTALMRSAADLPLPEFTGFEPGRYISVYLWFDRKITRSKFWTRTWSTSTLNYDFYDLSNIRTGSENRGSLIASNILDAQRLTPMSDGAIVEGTLRELAEFAPAAKGLQPVHHRVHRVPLAVSRPEPGFEARRPSNRVGKVHGLYVAGDWTRTALPESMESAVRSGRLAAEAVLEDVGRPRRIAIDPPATTGLAGVLRRTRVRL
jgi:15-cis-phytoene desaturase